MIVTADKIVHDVKVCIDLDEVSVDFDVSPLSDGLVEKHTVTMDDIIRQKLAQAIDRVHAAAPYHLLETGHNFGDAVYWGDMESGWLLLPADFLRMVVFEMSDWACPVYEFMTPADPRYHLQHSRYKGVRGTADHPVCVLGMRPEGRVLEFYSCRTKEAQVRRAVYIPLAKEDANGGWDISARCYDAVVYTAAGLSLMTIGEADKAQAMLGLAQSAFNS